MLPYGSQRLVDILRSFGLIQTLSVCAATIDERYLRIFDRRYRIRTSGHIELCDTSFDASKLRNATSYGPVNGWAFRRLLQDLNLPRSLHFADLGCGLGRACVVAAEYGFETVTGVELAPELCAMARENVKGCNLRLAQREPISIVQGDVLDYCDRSTDDLFFVFRAFSFELFREVREKLAERACQQNKVLTLIYTERLNRDQSRDVKSLAGESAYRKIYGGNIWGQAFYVYQCGGRSEGVNNPWASQSKAPLA